MISQKKKIMKDGKYLSYGKSYSHEDGPSHGDGVKWVADSGEEMDV